MSHAQSRYCLPHSFKVLMYEEKRYRSGSGGGNGITIIERCRDDTLPTDKKDRLVALDIWIEFKREFANVVYEAGVTMTLPKVVQVCARSQYLLRLAFDMPNTDFPAEKDIAALTETNPRLWNLIIADLQSGKLHMLATACKCRSKSKSRCCNSQKSH